MKDSMMPERLDVNVVVISEMDEYFDYAWSDHVLMMPMTPANCMPHALADDYGGV